jgi:hypothetical protein
MIFLFALFFFSCQTGKKFSFYKPLKESESKKSKANPPQLSQKLPLNGTSSSDDQPSSKFLDPNLWVVEILGAFSNNECSKVIDLSKSMGKWQTQTPLALCQKWSDPVCLSVSTCQAFQSESKKDRVYALNVIDFLIRQRPLSIWVGGTWYLRHLKAELLKFDEHQMKQEKRLAAAAFRDQARHYSIETERMLLIQKLERSSLSQDCGTKLLGFLKNFDSTKKLYPTLPFQTFRQSCLSEHDQEALSLVKKYHLNCFVMGQVPEATNLLLHTEGEKQRELMRSLFVQRQPKGTLQAKVMKNWMEVLQSLDEKEQKFDMNQDEIEEEMFAEMMNEEERLEDDSFDQEDTSGIDWFELAKRELNQDRPEKALILIKTNGTKPFSPEVKQLYEEALTRHVRGVRVVVSRLHQSSRENPEPTEKRILLDRALKVLNLLLKTYPETKNRYGGLLKTQKFIESDLRNLKINQPE